MFGTGSYVPEKVYTKEYLESMIDKNMQLLF